jgi:NAD+ diphosphatase
MTIESNFKFCPQCATPLAWVSAEEDGGPQSRWRCTACTFVHWNNPTPVLAAVVEIAGGDHATGAHAGKILLARNAAWSGKFYALITGFMEADESPQEGILREVKEETNLDVSELKLIGVYDFKRMNQVIIAYHARASGEVRLSPELVDYRLYEPASLKCWRSGTGYALADWLTSQGLTPQFVELPTL